uniref:NADH-ubiquinone oxidoreductase chain 4L n=1 Tax=Succineidae gen. n. sp. z RM-2021 TaxID=2871687 RepID=A0A977TKK3_9EUPU|nr:NADH dehydrogenase subunit 4L [Succineidae gen. n. sp. z RM-2021]
MNYYMVFWLLMGVLLFFLFVNKFHILMSLMILEMIMVLVLGIIFFSFTMVFKDMFIFIMILCISACEAAVGLSILISIIRCYGNDYMKIIHE